MSDFLAVVGFLVFVAISFAVGAVVEENLHFSHTVAVVVGVFVFVFLIFCVVQVAYRVEHLAQRSGVTVKATSTVKYFIVGGINFILSVPFVYFIFEMLTSPVSETVMGYVVTAALGGYFVVSGVVFILIALGYNQIFNLCGVPAIRQEHDEIESSAQVARHDVPVDNNKHLAETVSGDINSSLANTFENDSTYNSFAEFILAKRLSALGVYIDILHERANLIAGDTFCKELNAASALDGNNAQGQIFQAETLVGVLEEYLKEFFEYLHIEEGTGDDELSGRLFFTSTNRGYVKWKSKVFFEIAKMLEEHRQWMVSDEIRNAWLRIIYQDKVVDQDCFTGVKKECSQEEIDDAKCMCQYLLWRERTRMFESEIRQHYSLMVAYYERFFPKQGGEKGFAECFVMYRKHESRLNNNIQPRLRVGAFRVIFLMTYLRNQSLGFMKYPGEAIIDLSNF